MIKKDDLYFECFCGGVSEGEGERGRVCGRQTEVDVGWGREGSERGHSYRLGPLSEFSSVIN